MNNPGKIHTRTGMIELVRTAAPSRSCERAITEGRVTVLGGFSSIQPRNLPGWVCQIRSRHGRIWHLAVYADDVHHTFSVREIDTVPWIYWVGDTHVTKQWNPYAGDTPEDAKRERSDAFVRAGFIIVPSGQFTDDAKGDS